MAQRPRTAGLVRQLNKLSPSKATHSSRLMQEGNMELIESFLQEEVRIAPARGIDPALQAELYTASFWGFHDTVKEALGAGAMATVHNMVTGWTPLHAAVFQEHARVAMTLLMAGADPHARDARGLSPADFASVSDKLWAQFAAEGCTRLSRKQLVEAGVVDEHTGKPLLSKGMASERFVRISSNRGEPGENPKNLEGDVLAREDAISNARPSIPAFRLW